MLELLFHQIRRRMMKFWRLYSKENSSVIRGKFVQPIRENQQCQKGMDAYAHHVCGNATMKSTIPETLPSPFQLFNILDASLAKNEGREVVACAADALSLPPSQFSPIARLDFASFTAWRVAFFIPAIFQVSTALVVLAFGQDFPDADFHTINSKKEIQLNPLKVVCEGIKNYRGWILALTYGYCFGVELTVDNIIVQYFYDKFHLNLEIAGAIAASFGLANLFSRPAGGVISDMMGRRFGMRGRLWSLWSVQTMAGLLCIVLGRVNSLGGSIAVMVTFSIFLQAASGLTFGVVPFVSKRSLGVISGMTGSGGTVGAVITQLLLFSGSKYSKETGITLMGFMIVICTLPLSLIYFPHWGGMLCNPSLTEEDDYLLEEKEMSLG